MKFLADLQFGCSIVEFDYLQRKSAEHFETHRDLYNSLNYAHRLLRIEFKQNRLFHEVLFKEKKQSLNKNPR